MVWEQSLLKFNHCLYPFKQRIVCPLHASLHLLVTSFPNLSTKELVKFKACLKEVRHVPDEGHRPGIHAPGWRRPGGLYPTSASSVAGEWHGSCRRWAPLLGRGAWKWTAAGPTGRQLGEVGELRPKHPGQEHSFSRTTCTTSTTNTLDTHTRPW